MKILSNFHLVSIILLALKIVLVILIVLLLSILTAVNPKDDYSHHTQNGTQIISNVCLSLYHHYINFFHLFSEKNTTTLCCCQIWCMVYNLTFPKTIMLNRYYYIVPQWLSDVLVMCSQIGCTILIETIMEFKIWGGGIVNY